MSEVVVTGVLWVFAAAVVVWLRGAQIRLTQRIDALNQQYVDLSQHFADLWLVVAQMRDDSDSGSDSSADDSGGGGGGMARRRTAAAA